MKTMQASILLAAALLMVIIPMECAGNQTERVKREVRNPASEAQINNNETLYLHLVPHSHQDVGWLKTVDEYFYGIRPDIQKAQVDIVFDTVYEQLIKGNSCIPLASY